MAVDDETSGEDTPRKGESIQVIARAAAILRSLAGQAEGLSLGQIAKRVELPRSTVQRIVGALAAEQLVTAGRTGEGVRLGPTLFVLANAAQTDVASVARPHLEALTRRIRETCNLSMLQGHQSVCVATSVGDQELSVLCSVGDFLPLHCTSHGKALLAEMPEADVARLVGHRLQPLTPRTVRSVPVLLEHLREGRARGVFYSVEEHAEGIAALGVMLRFATGPRYALSVPVPLSRFEAQRSLLSGELLRCRDELEAAVGLPLRPGVD